MDDYEFEQLLKRKYAQVVLNTLLKADGYNYAFSALLAEVNEIVVDDSRGAKELIHDGTYSPASLSSLLSVAKNQGIVVQYLDDGQVRWRLRISQLSQSQIDEIRFRNSQNKAHADTSSIDHFESRHTDSVHS